MGGWVNFGRYRIKGLIHDCEDTGEAVFRDGKLVCDCCGSKVPKRELDIFLHGIDTFSVTTDECCYRLAREDRDHWKAHIDKSKVGKLKYTLRKTLMLLEKKGEGIECFDD